MVQWPDDSMVQSLPPRLEDSLIEESSHRGKKLENSSSGCGETSGESVVDSSPLVVHFLAVSNFIDESKGRRYTPDR